MKRHWLFFVALCSLLLTAVPGSAGTVCQNPGISCLQQGWKDTDRQVFYHKSQGTRMLYGMPYEWVLALEQMDNDKSFLGDDDHMKKFGFIPDNTYDPVNRDDPGNRDKLPVGLTKSPNKLEGGKPYLGFTCAACHTSRLHYNGHILQIDGSTSMQDSVHFTIEALKSLAATYGTTYKNNPKFHRFTKKALGKEPSAKELRSLHQAVGKFLLQVKMRSNNDRFPTHEHIYPTPWGPSRVDALGRGGNTLFTKLDMDNLRPANAPVSIPYLWGAWNYNWVQWNGSVQIPLARNVAQALLLDAEFKIIPPDRIDSSVRVDAIKDLEDNYAAKLGPPSWPEDILGRVSDEARLGKKLFGEQCAGCHIPKKEPNLGRKPDPLYVMKLIALDDIGTDPLHAFNFYARRAKTGELKAVLGRETVSVPEAMAGLTTRIIVEQKVALSADNKMQAPLAYMARPLAGAWATPPFLHNGSVPTLYQLLSPVEQRAEEFCVGIGRAEFDPVKVGLKVDACKEAFIFDTTLPGNSNAGHEFRNDDRAGHTFIKPDECKALSKHGRNGILGCELPDAERKAIIEYLKTCDLWRYPDKAWDAYLKEDPVKVCPERKAGP